MKTGVAVLVLSAATAASGVAGARGAPDQRRYALVIGYNGPAAADRDTPPLRFADDDALAFDELAGELGDRVVLLVSPDADTRRRYPRSDQAVPPTLAALDQAVARLIAEMAADKRAGRTTVLSFFYSGHGVRGEGGQAGLTMVDGILSRQALYEKVVEKVPADDVHLFVDACHAVDLARARDREAKVVPLSAEDVRVYLSQVAPGRFPHVGMAIANSRSGDAQEWDVYQSGVFTHELISALRGAADVNGDRRVEYSELGAFLAAANREVEDSRARLQALVKAPEAKPHAALVDLARGAALSRLTGIPAATEAFSVEDARGNRLADGRPERGFFMSLVLPAGRTLFLRRGDVESEFVLAPGGEVAFEALTFKARPTRARGAVESSLRAGLFMTQYGPAYYRGYVDRQDAVPVLIAPDAASFAEAPAAGRPAQSSALRWSLGGAATALLASSLAFGGMAWGAWRDNQGAVERASADAGDRFRLDTALSAGFLVSGALCATAAWLVSGETR